jgi:hypothetical protein
MTLKSHEWAKILIGPHTEIFSVYGGFVTPQELKTGLHVYVWLEGCKPLTKSTKTAAVIQVCATEPVPCLK